MTLLPIALDARVQVAAVEALCRLPAASICWNVTPPCDDDIGGEGWFKHRSRGPVPNRPKHYARVG